MSSPAVSEPKDLLDRAFAEHRAGHFDKARALLQQIDAQPGAADLAGDDAARLAELRTRFQPDWFAWLMLVACLLLFVFSVATTWH